MPFAGAIGTVYPAAYMRGGRECFNSYEMNFARCEWPLPDVAPAFCNGICQLCLRHTARLLLTWRSALQQKTISLVSAGGLFPL